MSVLSSLSLLQILSLILAIYIGYSKKPEKEEWTYCPA